MIVVLEPFGMNGYPERPDSPDKGFVSSDQRMFDCHLNDWSRFEYDAREYGIGIKAGALVKQQHFITVSVLGGFFRVGGDFAADVAV